MHSIFALLYTLIIRKQVTAGNDGIGYAQFSSYELFNGLSKYFFTIENDSGHKIFTTESNYILNVDAVRAVPVIMKKNGWLYGEKFQRWWLYGDAIEVGKGEPKMDVFDIDWVIKNFEEPSKFIRNLINNGSYLTQNANEQLPKELIKMYNAGHLVLPTSEAEPTDVVIKYNIDTDKNGHKVPLFDLYHFQNLPYDINWVSVGQKGIDDFLCAIANFSLRFTPIGQIRKLANGKFRFETERIATYLRDSFDFGGFQPLGNWDPRNLQASLLTGTGYVLSNASFRTYKERTRKGADFILFSSIKLIEKKITIDFEI